MEVFLYLLFGFFDVIAIVSLSFRVFRFPFREYILEFIGIGLILTGVSYLDRYLLNLASYDMAIQFVLYIILFRFLVKMRLNDSLDVIAIGYLIFVGVQFIVIPTLLGLNVIVINDTQQLSNLGIYIIQSTTDILCFIIASLLYHFNLGFSYKFRPPHDFYIKTKTSKVRTFTNVANVVATLIVCSTMYWVLNYSNAVSIVLPSVLVSLVLLVYLSYKKDYERV